MGTITALSKRLRRRVDRAPPGSMFLVEFLELADAAERHEAKCLREIAALKDALRARSPKARLTDTQILQARAMRRAGSTVADVARAFGIDHGSMSRLLRRVTWKHLR